MADSAVLEVRREGSAAYPWSVFITAGPAAGLKVGLSHRLKREAQAWVDERKHLPWAHLHPTADAAMAASEDIVTVTRGTVGMLVRRLAAAEEEVEVFRTALLEFNGSAMAVQRARAGLASPRPDTDPSTGAPSTAEDASLAGARPTCPYCVQWRCSRCGADDWPACCDYMTDAEPYWADGSVAVVNLSGPCQECEGALEQLHADHREAG